MTIRRKIFLRSVGLFTAMVIFICSVTFSFISRTYHENEQHNGKEHAELTARQCRTLLEWRDLIGIHSLLTDVSKEGAIRYAWLEQKGEIVVHTFPAGVPRGLLTLHPNRLVMPSVCEWKNEAGEVYDDIAASVEPHQAVLHLGLSRAVVDATIWKMLAKLLLVGGVVILLGTGLSYGMSVLITAEIDALNTDLREKQENLKAIFTSSPVGMLLLNEETIIVDANSVIAGMVSRDLGLIVDQRAGAGLGCVHSLENEKGCGFARNCPLCPLRKGILQVLTSGTSVHGAEIQVNLMIDGQEHRPWLRVSAEPILLHGRKHVVVAIDNITDHKRAEQELLDANRYLEKATTRANQLALDAEAASRLKSEFLANMSHEIRTPMTTVMGFADLLHEELRDCEDQSRSEVVAKWPILQEHCEAIHRNSENLLQIINDILDLSKVEAGCLRLECVECRPHQIIGDVISLMRPQALAKDLDLRVEYLGTIPRTVKTDPTRFKQALVNLVSNAVKFTPSGNVTLQVKHSEESGSPMLCIDVVDTGIGIPKDRIEAIFEPFSQADSSTTRLYGGTGLGLTITRRLAELLGGSVSVVSEVDRGSVFTLRIAAGPLDVSPIEQPVEELKSPSGIKSGSAGISLNYRILLVEDGEDNRRLITFILQKAGAVVHTAENGREGLDRALQADREGSPFDLILMDMQMPVMDGYQATRSLRERGYTRPILALTAHAMTGDRKKCLEAGCDDYIVKPIDRSALLAAISAQVERHRNPIATVNDIKKQVDELTQMCAQPSKEPIAKNNPSTGN